MRASELVSVNTGTKCLQGETKTKVMKFISDYIIMPDL